MRPLSDAVGSYSSVVIAARYGLYGPGIESWWGDIFLARPDRPFNPHPDPYTMGTGSFPGVKQPGRSFDHPPQSNAEVKEWVQLYLYSPFGTSLLVIRWTLPLLTIRRDYQKHLTVNLILYRNIATSFIHSTNDCILDIQKYSLILLLHVSASYTVSSERPNM